MTAVIYGLRCPVANAIRYIGKTVSPANRLSAHICEARKPGLISYKKNWIAGLLARGLMPEIVILEYVPDGVCWESSEKHWIAYAIQQGWPITNLASGGNGASPLSDEARKRKASAMSRPEVRARMSASAQARWSDPERRSKGLAALRTDEAKAKHMASVLARATPEYRAKAAERARAAWADPEKRARIVSKITPEVREKVSLAAKRMWRTSGEEKKDLMLANLRSAR